MALSDSDISAADVIAGSLVSLKTEHMVSMVKVSFSIFNSAEGNKYGTMDEFIQFPKSLVLLEVETTGIRI
jgi:hypothetical protein